jgi:LEA14-like dessication related protein
MSSRSLSLRWLPWLLALLLLSSGCVKEPTMQLHGAGVRGVSPMGVSLVMAMKVKNDNVFDVQVRNVSANVIIGKTFRMPTIHTSPNVWLRANSVTVVEVPMTVPWPTVMPLLSKTVGSHTIAYRAKGYADVTATNAFQIDRDDYAFDVEGEISRMGLVQAAMRGGFPMVR